MCVDNKFNELLHNRYKVYSRNYLLINSYYNLKYQISLVEI